MNMLRIIGADIDTTVQEYIQRPAKALSDKLVGFFEYVSEGDREGVRGGVFCNRA